MIRVKGNESEWDFNEEGVHCDLEITVNEEGICIQHVGDYKGRAFVWIDKGSIEALIAAIRKESE